MIDPASSPAFIFCLFQLDLYTPSKKCATRDKNNIHHAPLSTQESMCAVLYASFAQVLAPLGTCNHLIDHPYHLQRHILLMFEQNHPPRTYLSVPKENSSPFKPSHHQTNQSSTGILV